MTFDIEVSRAKAEITSLENRLNEKRAYLSSLLSRGFTQPIVQTLDNPYLVIHSGTDAADCKTRAMNAQITTDLEKVTCKKCIRIIQRVKNVSN